MNKQKWKLAFAELSIAAFLLGGTFIAMQPPASVSAQATGVVPAEIDVMKYGAIPESVQADNTLPFQKAIDAAALRGGGVVWVPFLRFYFRGNITIPEGVVLAGRGHGPYDPMQSPALTRQGPTLLPTALGGVAFIRIVGSNSGIQDLIITYPSQFASSAAAPRVYPPTILAEMPSKITRMTLTNSYEGIHAMKGRIYIEDCHIGAYYRDIVVDNALDEVRIVHTTMEPFWDWGYAPPTNIDFWVRANGTGITARKVDGFKLQDVLVQGRYIGIAFDASTVVPDGGPNGSGSDVNLDTVVHGVIATATEERVGFTFNNLEMGPISHLVIPGQERGHAIWLKRLGAATTTPPIINVVGGSMRQLWATQPNGADWAFRVDVGELYKTRILGDDISTRR